MYIVSLSLLYLSYTFDEIIIITKSHTLQGSGIFQKRNFLFSYSLVGYCTRIISDIAESSVKLCTGYWFCAKGVFVDSKDVAVISLKPDYVRYFL